MTTVDTASPLDDLAKERTETAKDPGKPASGATAGRRTPLRPQPDLSGFIGSDLWMVGKYEP